MEGPQSAAASRFRGILAIILFFVVVFLKIGFIKTAAMQYRNVEELRRRFIATSLYRNVGEWRRRRDAASRAAARMRSASRLRSGDVETRGGGRQSGDVRRGEVRRSRGAQRVEQLLFGWVAGKELIA